VIFSSFQFVLFFAVVLVLYYGYHGLRWRNVMLLGASYFFYWTGAPGFLWMLVGTTVLDYVVAHGIVRTESRAAKKAWVWASVAWNLGLIGWFKYADFFIENVNDVSAAAGHPLSLGLRHLIVPLGLSFYNFQSMSYALDVYRGEVKPTKDFIDFALCVAFFTHLVAGPIVRVNELLPQIERGMDARWEDIVAGVNPFAAGFTKKLLIADSLAPYVDRIFSDPSAYDSATLWCASIGFAMQCYCDFAGYTDMALGTARLLGFWLPENFRWPFLAANVADFWRRWHITLYSFMRDYLYISLGGSRVRPWRQVVNAMITMTVVGLWHGAAWNFVVWGLYNGILLVGYRFLSAGLAKLPRISAALATLPGTVLRIAVTDLLFFMSFTLFRCRPAADGSEGSLHVALRTLGRMLSFDTAGLREVNPWVGAAFAAVLLGSLWCELQLGQRVAGWFRGRRFAMPLEMAGYAVLIYVLVVFCPSNTQAFVYFQF
jgi:alginate O-acetyltransferase complex protein AlgI